MRGKIKIWLIRYLPAEAVAVIFALSFGLVLNTAFNNHLITALGAAWGDNIGYYGTITFRDLRKKWQEHKKINFLLFLHTLKNIFFEFGPSELLDSLLVRPFTMYVFPILLQNIGFGLVVGKVTADIIFYIPTITAYELRTKFGKR